MRILYLIIILLSAFPSFFAADEITADIFTETAGRGLLIRTNPPGAHVFIDGVERGLTPAAFENLRQGEYNIVIIKDGYKERRFNAALLNGSRLEVSIEMEEIRGFALITVYKEEGSPVYLSFEPHITVDTSGETISLSSDHRAILNLPSGYHTIKARAFGWEETSTAVLISEFVTSSADIVMKPAAFITGNASQSRKRFNPMNSNNLGLNEYRFEVSSPGTGNITILNHNETIVYSEQLPQFNTWIQNFTWNGRDNNGNPVPQGVYTVIVEASSSQTAEFIQIKMETEIDYSLNIYPLSLMSGLGGLVFAPVPDALPAGSFQLEAGLLYGYLSLPSEKLFTGFPFGIGLKVSLLKNLETSVFFNINPLPDTADWGITSSLKYSFLSGGLFNAAAGVFYTWAGEYGENPLSPGRGIGLYTPFSFVIIPQNISIILSPGVFWRGPLGIIPELLISAGVLYQGGWFNAAVSMRIEFNFSENISLKFLSAIEGRFYPSPSFLFFSAQAGLWTQGANTGGYGGISAGIIY